MSLIISLVTPIFNIIMPIIILSQFFSFNAKFGPWTKDNFLVYLYLSYNIFLLSKLITTFQSEFRTEKYWKTLQALIIAPFYRFNLLIGIFFANLIQISIPFIIFVVICFIYYPISFITLLFVLLIFLFIALIFSGIGLIIGVFAISNENLMMILNFLINILIWLSCISYPYELFPPVFQNFINLNPLYYIFDILRLTWIEDNIIFTFNSHFFHFFILISFGIIMPLIGVYIFNMIYRKYGIVGY